MKVALIIVPTEEQRREAMRREWERILREAYPQRKGDHLPIQEDGE